MAELIIDFTWYKDARGYRLVEANDIQLAQVVRKGGSLRSYRPLNKYRELFNSFAKISRTPKGALDFINDFGPLTNAGQDRVYESGGKQRGEPVREVLAHADMMRELLNGLSRRRGGRPKIPLTNLHAWLVNDQATGGIALQIEPATLRDALWLQLAQNLSSGVKVRRCRHCNEWFRAGPGTRRRADAEFCSDEHRQRFNSLKRSR